MRSVVTGRSKLLCVVYLNLYNIQDYSTLFLFLPLILLQQHRSLILIVNPSLSDF